MEPEDDFLENDLFGKPREFSIMKVFFRLFIILMSVFTITNCYVIHFLEEENCELRFRVDSLKIANSYPEYEKDQRGDQRYKSGGKPIIYLYPTDTTDVFVKLKFNESGHFTYTYPEYNNGWSVIAYPDGKLIETESKKSFYSLFWEGGLSIEPDDNTGFVVHRDSLNSFFEKSLDALGLNYKEAQEFIVFWSPKLMENEFTFVHFSRTNYAKSAVLDISPKPQTINRFLMLYRKADRNERFVPQKLTNPGRNGFVVVEWGGASMDESGIVREIR